MSGERVYAVNGATVEPLRPVTLADAGLRERQDLQEWVIARPEILGADVLVVAFEFDRWSDARGERQRDRLDVLGIDSSGRLVLAELKRDRAHDSVEMQAIKYAAMASRFTEHDLYRYHAQFLSHRSGLPVSPEAARAAIEDHVDVLDPQVLRQPRIVIVAGEYLPSTTATIVWLNEMGIDITLQRVQAYQQTDDSVVVTVSQLFPVPDAEEFTIAPIRTEVSQAREVASSGRGDSTVVKLVRTGTLSDGTRLQIVPTTEVNASVRAEIEEWLDEDERRRWATWRNNRSAPLQWDYTGEAARPTRILTTVLSEAAGLDRSVRGPSWWVTESGLTLTELASESTDGRFDWSRLHDLLDALPAGRWTTYGDLATEVGTAAQPLGQHVTRCATCVNLWRVLDTNGQARPGFRWSDPADQRTQQEALEAEGVSFRDSRADASRRIPTEELRAAV